MESRNLLNATLAALIVAALIVSGIVPFDRATWIMEVAPVLIALPAMVAREILIRGGYVTGRRMTGFLCICIAMAISASYELIEWATALAMGQGADEFLGTQGDQWDTQSDMFMALIGSSTAMLLLASWHDRQIKALDTRT